MARHNPAMATHAKSATATVQRFIQQYQFILTLAAVHIDVGLRSLQPGGRLTLDHVADGLSDVAVQWLHELPRWRVLALLSTAVHCGAIEGVVGKRGVGLVRTAAPVVRLTRVA